MSGISPGGHYVNWISDIKDSGVSKCGQKVLQLARLKVNGFPVPDGYCILMEAFENIRNIFATSNLMDNGFLPSIKIPNDMKTEIISNYDHLSNGGAHLVAVRSSATAEDLKEHSFAGLYDSFLNISGEKSLLNAIYRCWASYWNEEAVFYRQQAGIEEGLHGMAILIQRMVTPVVAGVIFTQSPVHPSQNMMVVEVVHGYGEALVGGNTRGDRFFVDRSNRHLLDRPGAKKGEIPSYLDKLIAAGFDIEKYYDTPQDIEWCIDDADSIWILQTRSVTGSADIDISDLESEIQTNWQRAYDEPFSPLGCDLAVRRQSFWVKAINAYYLTKFKPGIKTENGFIHYTTPWRAKNRMLRLWMWFWKIIRHQNAEKIHRKYKGKILPALEMQLNEFSRKTIVDLDDPVLLTDFNTIITDYLKFQYTSYPIVEIAKTSASLLNRLCPLIFGRNVEVKAADFLTGLANITVERDLVLGSMVQTLHKSLKIEEIEKLAGVVFLSEENGYDSQYIKELEKFFESFGYIWADRYPRDPAWKINRDALVSSLLRNTKIENRTDLAEQHERRRQRRVQLIDQAFQLLSKYGRFSPRRILFRWILERTERCFPHRENRNHYVYRSVMIIRKYASEIGHRLKLQGKLERKEDVYYLAWEEIQKIYSSSDHDTELLNDIQQRKRLYNLSKKKASLLKNTITVQGERLNVTEMTGEPCSPGIASGTARLINGLGDIHLVQDGDILVCSRLRPAWSPVFARVEGVVVQTGSLLSHGATLAREYGIPTVMNIPNLFKYVKDKDNLVVDGNTGSVIIQREHRVSEH
jgi:rifampicin phosphotransferase